MSKLWTSSPLVPVMALYGALSACSGASGETSAGDLDEYCASVQDADAICDSSERDAVSTEPAAPTEQTGVNELGPHGSDVPPGDLVFF